MNPIKERREAKSWTQTQLAMRVGITHAAVHHWEERGSVPNAQSLRKLAEVFEVDFLDLANELLAWQSASPRSSAETR